MSVQQRLFSDKTDSFTKSEGIAGQATAFELAVREAVQQGLSLDVLERHVFDRVLRIGHAALELFFSQQGDGDLGEVVATSEGRTLARSEQPAPREVRTVFGRHVFHSYVYAPGSHLKIELRPLEARRSLPAGMVIRAEVRNGQDTGEVQRIFRAVIWTLLTSRTEYVVTGGSTTVATGF